MNRIDDLEKYMRIEGYKDNTIHYAKIRLRACFNLDIYTLEDLEASTLAESTKESYGKALRIFFKAVKHFENENGGIVMKDKIVFTDVEYKRFSTVETEKGLVYKMDFERNDEEYGKVKLTIETANKNRVREFELNIKDKIDVLVSDPQARLV